MSNPVCFSKNCTGRLPEIHDLKVQICIFCLAFFHSAKAFVDGRKIFYRFDLGERRPAESQNNSKEGNKQLTDPVLWLHDRSA
jgi:hypothetical protein